MMRRYVTGAYLFSTLAFAVEPETAPVAPVVPQSAKDFFKAHAEFFRFEDAAQIPTNLEWQDGSDLPEYGSPAALKGGTVKTVLDTFPPSFRSVISQGDGLIGRLYWFYINNVEMPLVRLHPTQKARMMPGLARRWAVSGDSTQIFFELDPRAQYAESWINQNGRFNFDGETIPAERITTDNILYSLFLTKSGIIGAFANQNTIDKYVKSVSVYGPHLFSVEFNNADYSAIFTISDFISAMPTRFYAYLANADSDFYRGLYQWSFPPSSGAYRMAKPSDMSLGRSVRLERNKNWWGQNDKFNRYRFNVDAFVFKLSYVPSKNLELFGTDATYSFIAYEAIDLETKVLAHSRVSEKIESGELSLHSFVPDLPDSLRGIFINVKNPRLVNPRLREALVHAFDYDRVQSQLFRDGGKRIKGYFSGYGDFESKNVQPVRFDPNKVSSILVELGYARGVDGVFAHPQQGRARFELTTFAQWGMDRECLILKEQALKAGVEIICDIQEKGVAVAKMLLRNTELAIANRSSGVPLPNPFTLRSALARQKQSANLTNIDNPEIEALIERYSAVANETEAKTIMHELDEKVAAQFAFVPAVEDQSYHIVSVPELRFPEDNPRMSFWSPLEGNLFWFAPKGQ